MSRYKVPFLITCLVLVGLGLRFYGLLSSELYRDEAYSGLVAQQDFAGIISTATNDSSVPFAFFIQHIFGEIFGYSAFSLRLPSFLFSVIGMLYFWKLLGLTSLKKITKYFVFVLFCLNPPLIYNAAEARFYSIFATLFIYQLYLVTRIWQKKQITLSDQLAFLITSIIGIYNHSLYWLVLLGWGLTALFYIKYTFFNNRKSVVATLKKIALPYLLILLSFIPWVQILITQYARGGNGTWLKFDFYNTLVITLADFMYWPGGFNIYALDINGMCVFILGHLAILIVGFAIIKILTEMPPVPIINKFYSLLFTFFIVLFFVISVKTPLYYVRYQAFLIPIYLILLGMGIEFLNKKIRYFLIVVILLLTIFVQLKVIYPRDQANACLTDVISQIDLSHGSNYLVINKDALTYFNLEFYGGEKYTSLIFDKYLATPFWVGKAIIPENRFIQSIPKGKDQIFIVSDSGLEKNILSDLALQQYTKSEEYSYNQGLKLFLYVKNQ